MSYIFIEGLGGVVMSQRALEIIKLLIGMFLLKSVHWTFQRIQMLIQT